MCPGVESEQPGACPKCGMALERNPLFKKSSGSLFTCPMHPEVKQNHPGNCPICGMTLEKQPDTNAPEDDHELRDMIRRLWIGLIFAVPVVVLSMGEHMFSIHLVPHVASAWIQGILTTPVVLWAGWPFFQRGWQSLLTRHLNMFTLISMGTGVAYVFSVVVLLIPNLLPDSFKPGGMLPVYFEAAASIIVLVILGQVLELKARAGTGEAIRALLGLAPTIAHRVQDGTETDVPLEEVQVGDVLRVKPGEKIPVDGTVLEGRSQIDESMITGEPLPVLKEPEAAVTAGTLNGTGSFLMHSEHVGADTLLAKIITLVAQAQRSRAPIQRLADSVAAWFVPFVVLSALATFFIWMFWGPAPAMLYAIVNAVAVLIIACPCALGLATPMSIMVAVGRGAQMGILIRHAEALERLEKVNTLVVDKTGTLTEGKPTVTSIIPYADASETEILTLAAALEIQSEHPLAHAIVQTAKHRKINISTASQFSSITGGGISGIVDGHKILIGTRDLLIAEGVTALDAQDRDAERLQSQGETVIRVARDGVALGLLSLADPIKSTTPAAISSLRSMKIRVIMLTGDHTKTAAHIAAQLKISEFEAEISPAGKQDKIAQLHKANAIIAMAGDGVNDAPALAAADVGIAMGTGTDVAMQSAGVTLVKGDLQGIVQAVQLSRATMRNIRQNLAFAFLYNSLGIPIAAGLLYPFFGILLSPIIASAAMALSSVSVIINAIRLKNIPLR